MNSRFPTPLLEAIRLAATEIPFEVLLQIANGLCSAGTEFIEDVRREVTKTLGHSSFRRQMTLVLDEWGKCADRPSSESMGAALLSAAHLEVHRRNTETLELIWTGPTSPGSSLRRTDQALLGLVKSARSRLTIVSFAVYKAGSILHAIGEAIRRGVVVRIVLESHEESEGRLAFDTIKEIGDELAISGGIFVWPLDRRERDASDRIGVLHAKCAIADGEQLFISSANLTGDALSMNMELGVMIGGGPLPSTAEEHLSRLIELGTLRRTGPNAT